jgi:hypothetical protein
MGKSLLLIQIYRWQKHKKKKKKKNQVLGEEKIRFQIKNRDQGEKKLGRGGEKIK